MLRLSHFTLLLLPLVSSAQTPYLHDTFADREYARQALPASARWQTATPALLKLSDGALLLANDDKAAVRHIAARFTPPGQAVRLGIGEGITLSFDFVSAGESPSDPNAIRLAFLDSDGVTLPDGRNPRVSFRGYITLLHNRNGHLRTMRRTGEAAALISSLTRDSYSEPLPATGGQSGVPILSDQTYHVSFFIIRVSDTQLDIGSSITGPNGQNSVVTSDTGSGFTTFDTVVLAVGGPVASARFSNITITPTALTSP